MSSLPVILPAVVAGSVFTFSLSMGDYITVSIVGGTTQMLGNTIRTLRSSEPSLRRRVVVLPVVAMIFYLFAIRRTGALDNL